MSNAEAHAVWLEKRLALRSALDAHKLSRADASRESLARVMLALAAVSAEHAALVECEKAWRELLKWTGGNQEIEYDGQITTNCFSCGRDVHETKSFDQGCDIAKVRAALARLDAARKERAA